jgi:hypothetical protein
MGSKAYGANMSPTLFLFFQTPAMADGEDTAVECSQDSLEENDEQAAAAPMPIGTLSGLNICDGDDDWYVLTPAVGEVLSVQAWFSHADGDIDLKLFDTDGNNLESSASVSDNEQLDHYAASQQDVYLKVSLYVASESAPMENSYSLDVSSAAPPECTLDPHDPNEEQAMASTITLGHHVDLSVCEYDTDWYVLELQEAEQLSAELNFSNGEGDIDMSLYDAAGNKLISSATSNDGEQLEYIAEEQGEYKIQVRLYSDAGESYGNSYSMALSSSQFAPCQKDQYAPNASAEEAAELPPGSYDLSVCYASQSDYFSMELAGGETVNVQAEFSTEDGDLDISLEDGEGWSLASSSTSGGTEYFSYMAETDGTAYVVVDLFSDAGEIGVDYSLSIWMGEEDTAEPVSEPSAEPSAEPSGEEPDPNTEPGGDRGESGKASCSSLGFSGSIFPLSGLLVLMAMGGRRRAHRRSGRRQNAT